MQSCPETPKSKHLIPASEIFDPDTYEFEALLQLWRLHDWLLELSCQNWGLWEQGFSPPPLSWDYSNNMQSFHSGSGVFVGCCAHHCKKKG